MNDSIATWEDEGGSAAPFADRRMIGTLNQIAWAVQIKSQVDAEFDRVRKVLEYAMTKQSPRDVTDIEAIIRILENKRAEVMENEQAGYFIHDWQELGNQVSRMIVGDPRYQAIKASQTARFGLLDAHRPKEKII
jgi:cell division FtsZ-interacting protein ZapD